MVTDNVDLQFLCKKHMEMRKNRIYTLILDKKCIY